MNDDPLQEALEKMSTSFLKHTLDAFPMEFSIIDSNDEVRFWNQHDSRIFRRPYGVLGRNVRNCHPEKSLDKVLEVIEALRSGERDHVDFWIDLPKDDQPRKLLIRYFAIRDDEGKYLGTLEATINLSPLQSITGENRLGDFK